MKNHGSVFFNNPQSPEMDLQAKKTKCANNTGFFTQLLLCQPAPTDIGQQNHIHHQRINHRRQRKRLII